MWLICNLNYVCLMSNRMIVHNSMHIKIKFALWPHFSFHLVLVFEFFPKLTCLLGCCCCTLQLSCRLSVPCEWGGNDFGALCAPKNIYTAAPNGVLIAVVAIFPPHGFKCIVHLCLKTLVGKKIKRLCFLLKPKLKEIVLTYMKHVTLNVIDASASPKR